MRVLLVQFTDKRIPATNFLLHITPLFFSAIAIRGSPRAGTGDKNYMEENPNVRENLQVEIPEFQVQVYGDGTLLQSAWLVFDAKSGNAGIV